MKFLPSRRCALSLMLTAAALVFAPAARGASVTFQDRTYEVAIIPLATNIPGTNGCDLIFVYIPSTQQKLLVVPTDPTARASFDPEKQRFYRVDRLAGFINAFTTLNSTFLNLDGTFFAGRTETPLLGPSGQSTLESYQIPLDISTTNYKNADIALVDTDTLIFRTEETKIYDIRRDPNPFTLNSKAIPINAGTFFMAVEHDGSDPRGAPFDSVLLVQNKIVDPADATKTLPGRLSAYTRAGEFLSEVILDANPAIPGYKGSASGVAVDPLNGDIYVLDANQLILFTQRRPVFSTIAPKTGTYKGGTTVTLTGALFPSDATVTFGGVASPTVNVVSATTIQCATPPHTVGAVDVTVNSPSMTAPLTLTAAFSYVNNSPVAVLVASPTQGPVPLTTTFDISGCSDSDGTLMKRVLDFGDGSPPYLFPVDLANVTITHGYTTNGTFTALLVITDDLGATATSTQTIVVGTGGDDLIVPLVLHKLNLKVSPGSAEHGDKLQITADLAMPEGVEVDDLGESMFYVTLIGSAGGRGYSTDPEDPAHPGQFLPVSNPAITLSESAQYKQPDEKLTIKPLRGLRAKQNPGTFALTYSLMHTNLNGIVADGSSGRQGLTIKLKFVTALGRRLIFQKIGENQAVVDVKMSKGKKANSTLMLSRK